MGTRADFYVYHQHGKLEWVGSTGWDGYLWTDTDDLTTPPEYCGPKFESAADFIQAIPDYFDSYVTSVEGWPWPWETSETTDYAYVFDEMAKEVRVSNFGPCPIDSVEWPNMEDRQNVALDSRSGIIIFGE